LLLRFLEMANLVAVADVGDGDASSRDGGQSRAVRENDTAHGVAIADQGGNGSFDDLDIRLHRHFHYHGH